MPIRGAVIYRNPPDIVLEELLKAQKEAMMNALTHLHRTFTPRKFTKQGAREHKFVRRTRKYEIRKQKVKGHNDPLLWSGELKQAVLTQRPLPKSAGKRGVKLTLRGLPKHTYFTFSRRGGKIVDKNEELQSISQREVGIIEKRILVDVNKKLARLSAKRTVTIGPTGARNSSGVGIAIT